MKNTLDPDPICRLCERQRPLQDSHLLPRAMYKSLRDPRSNQPPYAVNESRAVQTSKQISDFLLCRECEQLFNRNGEAWVLDHCYRSNGFKLRDTLRTAAAFRTFANGLVFSGARIPDVRADKLVFFAASVFWRAAVHDWYLLKGDPIRIELGPYERSLREFVLGNAGFPDNMTLLVAVSNEEQMLDFAFPPHSKKQDWGRAHRFVVPGLTFVLGVGSRLPKDFYQCCSAHSEEKPIYVMPTLDLDLWNEVARMVLRHDH